MFIYKCKYIRKQLLDSNDWELYQENQNDRNWWSIFKKFNKSYIQPKVNLS